MNRIFKITALVLTLLAGSALAAVDSVEQSNILASALKQYYGIEGTFELSPVGPLATLGEKPTSVELLEMPPTAAKTMLIKARYMKDKVSIGEVTATFRAQWRINVWVARKQMNKGSVDIADFEQQAVDRLALRQTPVDVKVDLKGYEVANAIPAGAVLTWNYLKSQPLVRKGSVVDTLVQDGGLKIAMRAMALQDAGRGEAVVMRNLTTNRQFEAVVVNENLVQIRL